MEIANKIKELPFELKNLGIEIAKSKRFLLVYISFLLIFIAYEIFTTKNINFKAVSILFLLLIVVGAIAIGYYSKNRLISGKISYSNLYKVTFLIILVFGIIAVFLTPIADVCDETEHFWRAELVSHGEFFPNYVEIPNSNNIGHYDVITGKGDLNYYHNHGYSSIGSLKPLYNLTGQTIFDTNWDDSKVNYSTNYVSSAFAQNPFYGYLAQGFGIAIAKLLDLNNIWMLWFGRLANLILYSGICALAIKKAPILKIQLFALACLPLAIYQGASLSIDATVNALAILTIAYFLYMYKSSDKSLTWKNLAIFFIIALLGGLTKVTYMALLLLVFLIPKSKFKEKSDYILAIVGIILVIVLDLAWTGLFATHQLLNSWRGTYFLNYHVDVMDQIAFMMKDPLASIWRFINPMNFVEIFKGYFSFANLPPYGSVFLASLYSVFFAFISFLYPNDAKISKKCRIGALIIGLIIFIGTFLVQYLTWATVGSATVTGVFGRYFIPLLGIPPIVFALMNKKEVNDFVILGKQITNIDFWTIAIIMGFIGASLLLTVFVRY